MSFPSLTSPTLGQRGKAFLGACPRIVITSLPRSGSTSLARILNLHRDIHCAIEPFHPERYAGEPLKAALQGDLTVVLRALWRQWNAIKHVWEPSGWPFVGAPQLNIDLSLAGDRVLFLIRKNLLRRYVSQWLCQQTGYWIGSKEQHSIRLSSLRLRPISIRQAAVSLDADRTALDFMKSALSAHRACRIIYFEDFFLSEGEKQIASLDSLFEFLDATRPLSPLMLERCKELLDPKEAWNSPFVFEKIPNILEVEKELASHDNGSLFH